MDLVTRLPTELFLLVASRLEPRDLVRARRVSWTWLSAFSSKDVSLRLLRLLSPRGREVRLSVAIDELLSRPTVAQEELPPDYSTASAMLELERTPSRNWADTFAAVARRHHHLARGKPWRVLSLPMPDDTPANGCFVFRPVPSCSNRGDSPWHWVEPQWSYDPESALLVYPSSPLRPASELHTWLRRSHRSSGSASRGMHHYRLLDLEGRIEADVPFQTGDKIVRRVRLASSILAFEWIPRLGPSAAVPDQRPEKYPESEGHHGHFVTTFDVVRVRHDDIATNWGWHVVPRSNWPFPSLISKSFAPGSTFCSGHDANHYALLVATHTRVMFVAVWDMSTREPYQRLILGPKHINHHGFSGPPRLISNQGIQMRDGSLCVFQETHRGEQQMGGGPGQPPQPSRGHVVSCIVIPIAPLTGGPDPRRILFQPNLPVVHGPAWADICGNIEVGQHHLPFCRRTGGVDCGPGTSPLQAPCWRHENFPYVTEFEVVDQYTGVRFAYRTNHPLYLSSQETPPAHLSVRMAGSHEIRVSPRAEPAAQRNLGIEFGCEKGGWRLSPSYMAGDERWLIGNGVSQSITLLIF